MSYSLYLIRFETGAAVGMDAELFQHLIGPYVVKREPEHSFLQLRVADGGEADVYASTGTELELTSIMVTHFPRGRVLDLIARLADQLGAAVVLEEGVALVSERGRRAHLPLDLQPGAEVIGFTGAAIEAAIGRA